MNSVEEQKGYIIFLLPLEVDKEAFLVAWKPPLPLFQRELIKFTYCKQSRDLERALRSCCITRLIQAWKCARQDICRLVSSLETIFSQIQYYYILQVLLGT